MLTNLNSIALLFHVGSSTGTLLTVISSPASIAVCASTATLWLG